MSTLGDIEHRHNRRSWNYKKRTCKFCIYNYCRLFGGISKAGLIRNMRKQREIEGFLAKAFPFKRPKNAGGELVAPWLVSLRSIHRSAKESVEFNVDLAIAFASESIGRPT